MNLDPNMLMTAVVQVMILLLAVSAHEAAHAWTALRCGDSTAYDLGRVTLNPLRHIDLFGSILIPLVLAVSGGPVFGWARPTPVDLAKLKNQNRDHLLVIAAGPTANLLLGFLALIALSISLLLLGEDAGAAANACLVRDFETAAQSPLFPLLFTLVQMAFLNGFLAIFNLLPVPPLDGGQLVLQLLPEEWASRYEAIERYGFMIVLGLAILNVLVVLVVPVYVIIAMVISLST